MSFILQQAQDAWIRNDKASCGQSVVWIDQKRSRCFGDERARGGLLQPFVPPTMVIQEIQRM